MIRLCLLLLYFLLVVPVHAVYDPLSVPNNKYGMHIADFNDIADVAPLVNSSGGDWGYITIVASDSDRDSGRWQQMFDQMRRLHLIPLVRIATRVQGDHWVKPNPEAFDEIVSFLDSLNWPTKNRYVILYNEPNHAKEWGNDLNPEEYGRVFPDFARKLKSASEDFFVLPAGMDVSAVSDGRSLDAAEYIRRMIVAHPDMLNLMDGWTSHSYPNPAFSGSPFSSGRGTLRSYIWELSFLQSLGLAKPLPIFITETGWVHREGKTYQPGLLSSEQIGEYIVQSAMGAWADARIVAITPFVFNYQDVPFDTFSWKRLSGIGGYHPHYEAYKSLSKTKGTPRQEEVYTLVDQLLPPTLVAESTYTLSTQVVNEGQGILSSTDGYELILENENSGFSLIADILPAIEPGERGEITIHIKAPDQPGTYRTTIGIRRNGEFFPLQTQDVHMVPPPSLTVQAQLGWRREDDANDITVLVYDSNKLLHKFAGLSMTDGAVRVDGLTGIIPGHAYRVVILVPYYLPRQAIVPLESTHTNVRMKRLLPLDFNRDGTFTLVDVWALAQRAPRDMIGLFVTP
jgi:hypothetical protein